MTIDGHGVREQFTASNDTLSFDTDPLLHILYGDISIEEIVARVQAMRNERLKS